VGVVGAPPTHVGPHTMSTSDTNSDYETIINELSATKRTIYEAFVEHGPLTDDELVEKSGIKKGTSSPRRNDLVKLGLIEAVGTVDTPSGHMAKKWGLVPAERVAEARAAASAAGPRRRSIKSYPLDERLHVVRQLLDMDDVNDAIRESHGRAWSRVRGRANDRRGERNREHRENEARLREAQERGSPTAEYFKLRRILMQSNERVLAVSRLVSEELDRRYTTGQRIPTTAWPDVSDLLNDLARTCDETNERIQKVMGVLGDDVIEGHVVDMDDFMLSEGENGEATVA
jgi:hypothetical protein